VAIADPSLAVAYNVLVTVVVETYSNSSASTSSFPSTEYTKKKKVESQIHAAHEVLWFTCS
jgi:hypothetical protein